MRVSAVVVMYFPDHDVIDHVRSLSSEFDNVYIVDNTPGYETPVWFDKLPDNVHCHQNHENVGIATALNQGMDLASNDADFVALFDQDSHIDKGYRSNIFSRQETDPDFSKIAIIGPVWTRLNGVSALGKEDGSIDVRRYISVPTLITSGACISKEVFKAIGRFKDDYFIDNVDHEYALRARKQGYRVVVNPDLLMSHSLGAESSHRLLGKVFVVTNHNPVRRYYITRNKLKLWFSYGLEFPLWVLRDIVQNSKDVVKVFLFEEQKFKKLKAIIKGVIHATINVSGPLNARKN
jgi:rhamnosyltransferase